MTMRFVNTWIVQAGYSYKMTERFPNDADYKRWATREALTKYWNMGKCKYTDFNAK